MSGVRQSSALNRTAQGKADTKTRCQELQDDLGMMLQHTSYPELHLALICYIGRAFCWSTECTRSVVSLQV